MPSPNKGEKQQAFISRCMGSPEARKTFPEQDQRAAFCYSQWRSHSKRAPVAKTFREALTDIEKATPNSSVPPVGVKRPKRDYSRFIETGEGLIIERASEKKKEEDKED